MALFARAYPEPDQPGRPGRDSLPTVPQAPDWTGFGQPPKVLKRSQKSVAKHRHVLQHFLTNKLLTAKSCKYSVNPSVITRQPRLATGKVMLSTPATLHRKSHCIMSSFPVNWAARRPSKQSNKISAPGHSPRIDGGNGGMECAGGTAALSRQEAQSLEPIPPAPSPLR